MGEQHSCDVLIVDDDDTTRHTLKLLLEQSGYVVMAAHNGENALDILRVCHKRPSVILLDLHMPIMTGWEFRLEQKRDPLLAEIPVIIISADRSLEHQPFRIDAIGYFRKPLDIAELLTLIERYCKGAKHES